VSASPRSIALTFSRNIDNFNLFQALHSSENCFAQSSPVLPPPQAVKVATILRASFSSPAWDALPAFIFSISATCK